MNASPVSVNPKRKRPQKTDNRDIPPVNQAIQTSIPERSQSTIGESVTEMLADSSRIMKTLTPSTLKVMEGTLQTAKVQMTNFPPGPVNALNITIPTVSQTKMMAPWPLLESLEQGELITKINEMFP